MFQPISIFYAEILLLVFYSSNKGKNIDYRNKLNLINEHRKKCFTKYDELPYLLILFTYIF